MVPLTSFPMYCWLIGTDSRPAWGGEGRRRAEESQLCSFAWFAFLAPQKRYAEALKILQELEQQDPLSSLVKQGIGTILIYLEREEEAIIKLKEELELNPADILGYYFLDRGECFHHNRSLLEDRT